MRHPNFIFSAVLILADRFTVSTAYWQDFSLLGLDNVNDTESAPVLTALNFDHVSRNDFRIDGTVDVKDLCKYEMDAHIFYASKSKGKFVPTSYRIARGAVNAVLLAEYGKFLVDGLAETSDFPPAPAADAPDSDKFCESFENKQFKIENYVFNAKVLPKSNPNGFYKAFILLWEEKTVVAGLVATIRLS